MTPLHMCDMTPLHMCDMTPLHICDMTPLNICGMTPFRMCAILCISERTSFERWGAGVETQKYVRGDIGGWGRVPSNETYAPSLSTIYDGA